MKISVLTFNPDGTQTVTLREIPEEEAGEMVPPEAAQPAE